MKYMFLTEIIKIYAYVKIRVRNCFCISHFTERKQVPTIQIDVSNAALNHHWYRLSRVLSDGFK